MELDCTCSRAIVTDGSHEYTELPSICCQLRESHPQSDSNCTAHDLSQVGRPSPRHVSIPAEVWPPTLYLSVAAQIVAPRCLRVDTICALWLQILRALSSKRAEKNGSMSTETAKQYHPETRQNATGSKLVTDAIERTDHKNTTEFSHINDAVTISEYSGILRWLIARTSHSLSQHYIQLRSSGESPSLVT